MECRWVAVDSECTQVQPPLLVQVATRPWLCAGLPHPLGVKLSVSLRRLTGDSFFLLLEPLRGGEGGEGKSERRGSDSGLDG